MGKFDLPVFVFGNGATIGSGYYLDADEHKNPPSNEAFFKELVPDWEYSVPALMAVCKALSIRIEEISLETLWNYIYITRKYVEENLISISSRLDSSYQYDSMARYAGKALENPEISLDERFARLAEVDLIYLIWLILRRLRIPQNGTDNYKDLFKEIGLISQENRLKKQFGIISFNYDICLEQSLRNLDNSLYYYPNFELKYRSELIPTFKLHGSLNWKRGYDGHVRPTDNFEMITEEEFIVKHPQLFGEAWKDFMPMIIPPTFFKEELFFPSGQERVRRHFNELWRRAYQLLCQASCLIIIGYSFPEADPHARWLLKAAGEKPSFIVNKYSDEKEKRKYENIAIACLNRVDAFCHEGFGQCLQEIKEWMYE